MSHAARGVSGMLAVRTSRKIQAANEMEPKTPLSASLVVNGTVPADVVTDETVNMVRYGCSPQTCSVEGRWCKDGAT